jgi:DNA-binding response OmpR family regulator
MGLTQKEFALLLVLAQNEGKFLSKEYLYEKVWKQPAT